MAYTFLNPNLSDSSLHTFSTLNHPHGEGALETLSSALQRGDVSHRDLWLLEEDGKAQAAFKLQPYPSQPDWRLGTLRTVPDISDAAVTVLLRHLRELSAQGKPIHLVYDNKSARDFGILPTLCGWQGGDDYGITYQTDLGLRDDLAPDPLAVSHDLSYIFGDTFRAFYEPIRRPNPSDARSFEQILKAIFDHHSEGSGSLIALEEANRPVAMGIVTTLRSGPSKDAGGVNMLGVARDKRRQGWGQRLHRHLMWEVKRRAGLYIGETDASNTAMRRLFEINGCTEDGKTWELEPV